MSNENVYHYLMRFIREATTLSKGEQAILATFSKSNKHKLRKGKKMYDEELNLNYGKKIAPIIEAIKKGYSESSAIAEITGIDKNNISAWFNSFYKSLCLKGLLNGSIDKNRRVGVVEFIQARMQDKNYIEKASTPVEAKIPQEPEEKTKEIRENEKMKVIKDCANCQKDLVLEVSELTMKLEEAQEYIEIQKLNIEALTKLSNFLQSKNETLENKIKIYIQHIENQKGYTEK